MPPRRRRTTEDKPLVLAIIGSADMPEKALGATLDELVGKREDVSLLLFATKEHTWDTAFDAADWADECDPKVPYSTISDDSATTKNLKSLIQGGEEDYDGKDDPIKAFIDFAADEQDKEGKDVRVLFAWPAEDQPDDDYRALELAVDAGLPTFDVTKGMTPKGLEALKLDDGSEPEPPKEEPKTRSRRSRAAADDDPPADEGHTEAGLKKLTQTELKKIAQDMGAERKEVTGVDKDTVIDLILVLQREKAEKSGSGDGDDEPKDEPKPRARRSRASAEDKAAADEAQADKDTDAARRQRATELAEDTAITLVKSMEGDFDAGAVAGALAGALMTFAEFIITEVRKPKSAGRPRADGTEAQPRRSRRSSSDDD